MIDLDMAKVGEPLDWSKVPFANKPKRPRKGRLLKPIPVALRERTAGRPRMFGPGTPPIPASGLRPSTVPSTWEWCRASGFWMRPRAFGCSITPSR